MIVHEGEEKGRGEWGGIVSIWSLGLGLSSVVKALKFPRETPHPSVKSK